MKIKYFYYSFNKFSNKKSTSNKNAMKDYDYIFIKVTPLFIVQFIMYQMQ